ncbi:DUF5954 family protein [Actinomadura livida]|uniref:PE-PGRS family protein n=1 Tax=Actinomadura livida TaxID=79909 RepID=A0A7W7N027_9ACTN|nr:MULTISPECIES: DUF5954 family protein [Actinomadura]MBB4776480.1 hypothetical protein [Actinomadura catellatispora]GGT92614.1 hypothetical protein GCM10010208_14420 [Actinomadura livida]
MTTGDGDAGGRLFPEDLDGVDPVAAVMLADACRALSAYPELVAVGALFTAAEQVTGGWRVVCPCDPLPQGARELLAGHLLDLAASADRAAARELHAAAQVLQETAADEVTACGRRLRIVRIQQLVRTGPDGPEPPRPTDLDTDPGRRFELLPEDGPASDLATAELLCQVLDAAAADGSEPSGAFLTPVALAPAFTVAERSERRWRPVGRLHDTPRQARDSLVTYFRHVVPAVENPGDAALAQFTEAADLMEDDTRRNGIAVAGRRFRIVRVERITLMGPIGPEPPRATDFDAC